MSHKLRIVTITSWAVLFLLLVYLLPDQRLVDGTLELGEAKMYEVAAVLGPVFMMLGIWLYGVAQLASSRKWGLFWIALFVWPVARGYLIFRKQSSY